MGVHWHLLKRKQKRVPVSLLHLPDELLLQVIDELGERDLYAMSAQCKRLQRICFPPYLLRLGISSLLISPIDHLIITPPQSYAPGIPLALFAKKVKKLSLEVVPSSLSVTRTARAVRRLCGMIITIEGLEDLVLNFKSWHSNHWHFNAFYQIGDWDISTEACILLLKVVAKRCIRLTLGFQANHTGLDERSIAELEKEATKWRSSFLLNKGPFIAVSKRLSLEFSRSRSFHVSANHHHRSSTLNTLIFESNTFLLPPFSGWVFKILNTASLTRLDLVEVSLSFTGGLSALVFGALTLPTLEYFSIIACNIDLCALAEFLSRHRTILTFEITSLDPVDWQLPITTLPALVSLKSTPRCTNSLLAPTGAFPKLTHLRVVIYFYPGDEFRLLIIINVMENFLARSAKRLSETNIRLRLDILRAPRTASFQDRTIWPWNTSEPRHGRYTVLGQVREIVFGVNINVPSPAALPTLLFVFPLLEHIEFLGAVGLDHQAKMSLVRLIVQTCPRIRSVRIGEDTRDVSAWLCSDNDR